ncbi:MAG: heavy metal translocating P-type ATPase [Chloroflexota bacterium]|nr:heavy metal translocating P-type ATPase [Chloroflexota bacterium]MDE2896135.1 heavy metal translocating P-type ATPase [Chloroflexota bacterium]
MTTATEHQTQTLRIEGMHCAACVRRVERALIKIDGISEASADFIAGRAVIEVERPIEQPSLSAAISGAGYELIESGEAEEAEGVGGIAPLLLRAGPALFLGWGIFVAMQANRWGEFGWNPDVFFPILFGVATPTIAWSLWPMLRRAALAASRRTSDMDTLIVLGVTAAWGYSTVSALFGGALEGADASRDVFFDTALIIVGFVSLGRALEARVRIRAAAALTGLLELAPQTARVVENGLERDIPASEVAVGDTLRVRPGEQIPVDGVILNGSSSIDESMLTGESVPVSRGSGELVFAGTMNLDGAFSYQATQVGATTALARITSAVERAQSSKAPVQRLADRIASVFVPAVVFIALMTFVVWAVFGNAESWTLALLSAVAVLVVACPCALGLATPAAIAAGSGRAARLGILFRDAEALEAAGKIDTVIWDKTGTLTTGRPQVSAVEALGVTELELLRAAVAVEQHSEHPLGAAIVAHAEDMAIATSEVSDFRNEPGRGAGATLDGQRITVGNAVLMSSLGIQVTSDGGAETPVYVARDDDLIGVIRLSDEVKPGAAGAVSLLTQHGIESMLVSGDSQATADAVSRQVGIRDVHAQTLPIEKAGVVEGIQAQGRRVAMVGDGVNDAPALGQADLGLAMRTGSDIALETAQVELMQSNPLRASQAVLLARATRRVIRQNLGFAFAYNILLIPLAAGLAVPIFDAAGGVPGGLTWLFGERGQFEPIAAALAMVASSISVLTNALRLNRWQAGAT